jgi:hypothetical protein
MFSLPLVKAYISVSKIGGAWVGYIKKDGSTTDYSFGMYQAAYNA